MATEKPQDQAGIEVTRPEGPETQEPPRRSDGTPASMEQAVVPDHPADFRRLDPRVIRVWKTTALIRMGIFVLAGIAGGTLLWLRADLSAFVIVPVWLVLGLLFLLETKWLPPKRYEATSYRIGEGFFEFRSGIVWKTSVMIPISRVQHIDLVRGPLEQHHGLATLDLHTAGTSKASQKVSGLEAGAAIQIREKIMAAADLEWDPVPRDDTQV